MGWKTRESTARWAGLICWQTVVWRIQWTQISKHSTKHRRRRKNARFAMHSRRLLIISYPKQNARYGIDTPFGFWMATQLSAIAKWKREFGSCFGAEPALTKRNCNKEQENSRMLRSSLLILNNWIRLRLIGGLWNQERYNGITRMWLNEKGNSFVSNNILQAGFTIADLTEFADCERLRWLHWFKWNTKSLLIPLRCGKVFILFICFSSLYEPETSVTAQLFFLSVICRRSQFIVTSPIKMAR